MTEEERNNFNWEINNLLLLIARWNANIITYNEFIKSIDSNLLLDILKEKQNKGEE